MLPFNEKLKLSRRILDLSIERVSMRDGFGEGLLDAAEENENIVALCADLEDSTRVSLFAKKYPERYIEIGVAEQNLASVASGMAAMGKIPFIASYAIFSPGRNWEQIRTTICYNNLPVKIIGSHAGVSVGPDGGSHQATEDIAITRVLPNMTVVVPCDALEAARATIAIAETKTPAYLRLSREKTPVITTDDTPFKIGKANVLIEPEHPEVTIVVCGPLVYQAIRAAKKLQEVGVKAVVINNHTIKPLDEETIITWAKRTGAVVTVEEHQKAGGLGSTVAETLARLAPVPMEFVGVDDKFGQSGGADELIERYGMGCDDIIVAVLHVLERKPKLQWPQSVEVKKVEVKRK